ncbi:MAG: CHASE2 domain-containing protein [candidate division KSB1 bacterium]|nr:CHASE2 domain-containing protein [candidate division KSB1 bacterium]MDZ7302748.1 CHASE2 domain-containing protein [candidate division KSB1 bacterium]MDZ7310084.1 CHASE2 domain-containing protein [candidate division KSB1 bacterium]
MTESLLKKSLLGAGLGLLAGGMVLLVTWILLPTAFRNFEAKTLDLRYPAKLNFLATQRQGANIEDIIIVDIDNRSLDKLGRYSQWPRSYHARIIDYLHAGGAACIVFDMLFMERDANLKEDSLFIRSTRKAGNVVHSLAFSEADNDAFLYRMDKPPAGFAAERFTISLPDRIKTAFPSMDRFDGKVMELYNSSAALGFANFLPDEDSVIREMPLLVNFAGQVYPSLALAVVMQFTGITGKDLEVEPGREIRLGRPGDGRKLIRIPIDHRGRALINFMGTWKTFRYVSYYDVLEQRLPAETFQDRLVLIGTSVAGLSDLRPVPFQPAFPGVEIHANIIYNILTGDFITRQSAGLSVAVMLIFAMIAGVVTMVWSPWISILVTIVLGVGYTALTFWVFVHRNVWIPEVQPILAFVAAFLSVMVYRFLSEQRQKHLIKGMFVHYLSEVVVDELIRDPSKLKLGGDHKYATAFFSDIQDFTTISEKLSPEALITQLNEYLSVMTDIVLAYGGYLDKYVGDAVVAVFGVPLDQIDHAERACFAALDMKRALVELRKKWVARRKPVFEARIGINTGEMVAGNIGGQKRFNYTVIGDDVNLASRLEGTNKMYGTQIMIGEETHAQAKDKIIARELDFIRVKGKSRPVRVYELCARRDDDFDKKLARAFTHFARGLELYRLQKWQNAIFEFRRVLELKPNDGPAKEFLRRCDIFMQSPRPPDWDGVFEMRTK